MMPQKQLPLICARLRHYLTANALAETRGKGLIAGPYIVRVEERLQGHAWQVHFIQQAAGLGGTTSPLISPEVLGDTLQDVHW